MTTIETAVASEAAEWLETNAQLLYEGVKTAVFKEGLNAAQIYRRVLNSVGEHRAPLAKRCELTAVHLLEEKATHGQA